MLLLRTLTGTPSQCLLSASHAQCSPVVAAPARLMRCGSTKRSTQPQSRHSLFLGPGRPSSAKPGRRSNAALPCRWPSSNSTSCLAAWSASSSAATLKCFPAWYRTVLWTASAPLTWLASPGHPHTGRLTRPYGSSSARKASLKQRGPLSCRADEAKGKGCIL